MPDYSEYRDEGVADNIMTRLVAKAREQLEAEKKVAKLAEELQKETENLRRIAEYELPKLMEEAEVDDFSPRDTGLQIVVKETLRGSIPAANYGKALMWLEENGHENLIKREFKISFGREDEAWAKKFQRDLAQRKKPVNADLKRTVAPPTLLAFVRQAMETGEVLPLDLFGVYRQRAAKVVVKA